MAFKYTYQNTLSLSFVAEAVATLAAPDVSMEIDAGS